MLELWLWLRKPYQIGQCTHKTSYRERSLFPSLFFSLSQARVMFINSPFTFHNRAQNSPSLFTYQWGSFSKMMTSRCWFLCLSFPQTQISKWPTIVTFSNSSSVVWTENIWCVFRVKPSFLNSSSVVWAENIWCVFRPNSPFSNFSSLVPVNEAFLIHR